MYLPRHFQEENQESAFRLMEKHPFATVITLANGEPFVNHFPVLASRNTKGEVRLLGHMSRANPQWMHFADGLPAKVVFHGPHAYVSPRWYSRPDVPTWNYAVVHATGAARVLTDPYELVTVLQQLAARFEQGPDAWRFSLPEDLASPAAVMKAIVGFEIRLEKIDAKFKLSQNRSQADRRGVMAGLIASPDDLSRDLLALMEERENRS